MIVAGGCKRQPGRGKIFLDCYLLHNWRPAEKNNKILNRRIQSFKNFLKQSEKVFSWSPVIIQPSLDGWSDYFSYTGKWNQGRTPNGDLSWLLVAKHALPFFLALPSKVMRGNSLRNHANISMQVVFFLACEHVSKTGLGIFGGVSSCWPPPDPL